MKDHSSEKELSAKGFLCIIQSSLKYKETFKKPANELSTTLGYAVILDTLLLYLAYRSNSYTLF